MGIYCVLPSGKTNSLLWKVAFLLAKSTISMVMFNSKLLVYQRVFGSIEKVYDPYVLFALSNYVSLVTTQVGGAEAWLLAAWYPRVNSISG